MSVEGKVKKKFKDRPRVGGEGGAGVPASVLHSPKCITRKTLVTAFLFFKFYLFLAALGLRCCEGSSLVAVQSLLLQWLFRCGARAVGHAGFSSCGSQTL